MGTHRAGTRAVVLRMALRVLRGLHGGGRHPHRRGDWRPRRAQDHQRSARVARRDRQRRGAGRRGRCELCRAVSAALPPRGPEGRHVARVQGVVREEPRLPVDRIAARLGAALGAAHARRRSRARATAAIDAARAAGARARRVGRDPVRGARLLTGRERHRAGLALSRHALLRFRREHDGGHGARRAARQPPLEDRRRCRPGDLDWHRRRWHRGHQPDDSRKGRTRPPALDRRNTSATCGNS